jgi:uncharacterized membrane protein YfcA
MMVVFITNVGGVGGGGIIMPVIMAFFKLDSKNSVALSNLSLSIASTIRFILNANRPHPLKNGKGLLIDLSLTSIILPMIVSGV